MKQWIAKLFRRAPDPEEIRRVVETFTVDGDRNTVLRARVIEVRPPGCDMDLRVDLWAQYAPENETFQLAELSAKHAGAFADLLSKAAAFVRNRSLSFPMTFCCETRMLLVQTDRYTHGGGLVVDVIDESNGEPYATASVNLGISGLADDEFVFKTYSENEGLLEAMLEAGVVERTGRNAEVGRAGLQPICRLVKR